GPRRGEARGRRRLRGGGLGRGGGEGAGLGAGQGHDRGGRGRRQVLGPLFPPIAAVRPDRLTRGVQRSRMKPAMPSSSASSIANEWPPATGTSFVARGKCGPSSSGGPNGSRSPCTH